MIIKWLIEYKNLVHDTNYTEIASESNSQVRRVGAGPKYGYTDSFVGHNLGSHTNDPSCLLSFKYFFEWPRKKSGQSNNGKS